MRGAMRKIFVPGDTLVELIPLNEGSGGGCLGLIVILFLVASVVDSYKRNRVPTPNTQEFITQRALCAPTIAAWDQTHQYANLHLPLTEVLSRTGSYSLPQGLAVLVNQQPPPNPQKQHKTPLSSITFRDQRSEAHTCWVSTIQLATGRPPLEQSGIIAPSVRMNGRSTEGHGPKTEANGVRRDIETNATAGPSTILEQERKTSSIPNVYRIGGGVSSPVIVKKIEPEYSEEARNAKRQGTVQLIVTIDETGHARDIKVEKSLGFGLDEKALEAVGTWLFKPAMKDGKPVAVYATIEVTFHLL